MKFLLPLLLCTTALCTYKIAFVKQVLYQDLYCASSSASKREIVFSSLRRSGPVALFSALGADFYIAEL